MKVNNNNAFSWIPKREHFFLIMHTRLRINISIKHIYKKTTVHFNVYIYIFNLLWLHLKIILNESITYQYVVKINIK